MSANLILLLLRIDSRKWLYSLLFLFSHYFLMSGHSFAAYTLRRHLSLLVGWIFSKKKNIILTQIWKKKKRLDFKKFNWQKFFLTTDLMQSSRYRIQSVFLWWYKTTLVYEKRLIKQVGKKKNGLSTPRHHQKHWKILDTYNICNCISN